MPDAWQSVGDKISLDQLSAAAEKLLDAGADSNIWLFVGEMGSGKTTLIKAIAELEGVEEGMSSPTFSIVNEYDAGKRKIYHFDLYRIKSERELIDIGLEEYFDSDELCLVEWPDKLGSLTPPDHFEVRITPTGADHRKIEFKTHGSKRKVGI